MVPAVAQKQIYNYGQSLHTASLELKYERSTHLVDIISKDEAIRKLRFEVQVLEDDVAELHETVAKEEDRSEVLNGLVEEHLARAEAAEASLRQVDDELQAQEQELSNLRAESKALQHITSDANKNLSEKLELTRELSTLKPELEHLRSQNAANKDLLAEKLSLQRQLSESQVQLEHSKREAQRAQAKRRNTLHELAQEDEVDTLQRTIKLEKRLREKAEGALEQLQLELEDQKKAAQRLLAKELKEVEQVAAVEVRSEELTRELAKEKKERIKAEKALQRTQSDWDGQNQILLEKNGQFRAKLVSTKEKVKELEAALEKAQEEAAAAPKQAKKAPGQTKVTKASKKRTAIHMDPDATNLGTPGDGAANKRSRKNPGLGEKSSFSITPFLNRTLSVAPDTPEEGPVRGRKGSVSEGEASPTVVSKPANKEVPAAKKKQPLAAVPASETNIQKPAPRRKKNNVPILEKVIEEDESSQPKEVAKEVVVAEPAMKPKSVKPKVRKSLAAFATFNFEPEPEKKKKRKLGGLGKTLFDEEDDAPTKALPGRGLFGNVRMGPLGGFGAAKGSFLGGKKSGLVSTEDGFQFSPLKKDRKMMSFIK